MSAAHWQNLVIFAVVAAFLAYRFRRFRAVRKALPELLRNGAIVVDVRSPQEFAADNNPISVNAPLAELAERSKNWDRCKTVILCCASGTRSAIAVGVLKKLGFRAVLNAGPWTNTLPA